MEIISFLPVRCILYQLFYEDSCQNDHKQRAEQKYKGYILMDMAEAEYIKETKRIRSYFYYVHLR